MGLYLFQNPETQEVKEIFQKMDEEHVFYENGIKWVRIFTIPQASIDTKWDINNPKDFVEKTRNKKGTLGSIMDKSREMSEKREEKYGRDEIKQKYFDNYSKTRGGRKHMQEKKEKLNKALKGNKNFEAL